MKKTIKILSVIGLLTSSSVFGQTTTNNVKIGYTFKGPFIPTDYQNSYISVIVTGSVTQVSQIVTLETSLDLKSWKTLGTNTLVPGRAFWVRSLPAVSWAMFYDYDWRMRPAAFYRLRP